MKSEILENNHFAIYIITFIQVITQRNRIRINYRTKIGLQQIFDKMKQTITKQLKNHHD